MVNDHEMQNAKSILYFRIRGSADPLKENGPFNLNYCFVSLV